MIAIVGGSASGKTALVKALVAHDNSYGRLVTYTTRPKRAVMENGKISYDEREGEDYHFVSVKNFMRMKNEGFFAETSVYNGWHYGVPKKDVNFEDGKTVAILTPAGVRKLRKEGMPVFCVYLRVDRRSRLLRMLERGDNIDEAYRRNLSDLGQFDGFENEADAVIENDGYKMSVKEALVCLLAALAVNEGQ